MMTTTLIYQVTCRRGRFASPKAKAKGKFGLSPNVRLTSTWFTE